MKRSNIIVLLLTFLSISCISWKNISNKNIFRNKIHENDSTFENFLSFFPQKNVPFNFSYNDECKNYPLPNQYTNMFKNYQKDKIIPIAKINIYDKYIGIFIGIRNTEEPLEYDFLIYNKKGKFIDSWTSWPDDFYDNSDQEYSIFEIDKFFNIFIKDAFGGTYSEWEYNKDNNTATYTIYHKDYEYTDMSHYKIWKTGKIGNGKSEDGSTKTGIPNLDTVENFLDYLGRDNKSAFKIQKIKAWGNYDNFSSPQSFGGIFHVHIDSIGIIDETENSTNIYCNADYIDTINGNSHVEQVFSLSKQNGNWFITKMKVLSFERYKNYTCDDFNDGELSLTKITKKGFDFDLLVVSFLPNNEDSKYAGKIENHAVFITPNHAVYQKDNCKLDFYFKGTNQVKIIEKDCKKHKNANIKFNGIFIANL